MFQVFIYRQYFNSIKVKILLPFQNLIFLKKIYLFFLLVAFSTPLSARHIIGGEITYRCNGAGGYTFTMLVYRDCNSGGAPFDTPAKVSIYRESNGGFQELQTLDVALESVDEVPLPDDPCTNIPNVCVEIGTYIFSTNLPALSNNDQYHVLYQRCCRNNTIANLNDPGSQGATYIVSIPAPVTVENDKVDCTVSGNSSPVFDNFPPIVICATVPIDFDHGATDPNGDQLVYRFCSPLRGGGLIGSPGFPGDPASCQGVAPDPACPPPHDEVSFAFPTYSPTNPMGGDPVIDINPSTGLITGTPELIGQYVVGVCVEEYRNGELLSLVRRDFQFNVTTCQPLVAASIESDEIINGNQFLVTSCGQTEVTFINTSEQRSNIDEFFWSFDTDGDGVEEIYEEWSPTIAFPDTGFYQGILVLNPGLVCVDTAIISLNVFPGITADYSYDYDTCISGPVTFTDASVSEAGPNAIIDWFWDFADGNNSSLQNPVYSYLSPGEFPVSLTVTDINGCQTTETLPLPYFPAPAVLIVQPSTFLGCEPADILFSNLSTPIDSTYDILWDFGDGNTSTEISPTHVYEEQGVYSISLEVTSPIGCFAADSFNNYITILSAPVADFTYLPEELTSFAPTATFTDESVDAATWFWQFDESGSSFLQNPVFEFPDTGQQVVTLVVTHESGCTDTAQQILDVVPQVTYFLPNAFTPNFDDLNDEFMGVGIFDGMLDFQMQIFNRWGEQVFATTDPNIGWNGKKNNAGKLSPAGVYVYQARFINPRGRLIELKGYATLIK